MSSPCLPDCPLLNLEGAVGEDIVELPSDQGMEKDCIEGQAIPHLVLHQGALSNGRETMQMLPGSIRSDNLDVGELFGRNVVDDPAPPSHPETEPADRIVKFGVFEDVCPRWVLHPEVEPWRRNAEEVPGVFEEGEGLLRRHRQEMGGQKSIRAFPRILEPYLACPRQRISSTQA